MIAEPALGRHGSAGPISVADDEVLLLLERDPVYHETLMRFIALRLLDWGMRKKDVAYLCEVPSYFLTHTAAPLERTGGAGPGPWTICRHKVARREAAMFAIEWMRHDQPFTQKPSAVRLATAYSRYSWWSWRDASREHIDPSTALAIIRNVGCGELGLLRCLRCARISLQHAGSGRGGASCSFCDCAHATPVTLTVDHRIPQGTQRH